MTSNYHLRVNRRNKYDTMIDTQKNTIHHKKTVQWVGIINTISIHLGAFEKETSNIIHHGTNLCRFKTPQTPRHQNQNPFSVLPQTMVSARTAEVWGEGQFGPSPGLPQNSTGITIASLKPFLCLAVSNHPQIPRNMDSQNTTWFVEKAHSIMKIALLLHSSPKNI